jgi:hypothetical protein
MCDYVLFLGIKYYLNNDNLCDSETDDKRTNRLPIEGVENIHTLIGIWNTNNGVNEGGTTDVETVPNEKVNLVLAQMIKKLGDEEKNKKATKKKHRESTTLKWIEKWYIENIPENYKTSNRGGVRRSKKRRQKKTKKSRRRSKKN